MSTLGSSFLSFPLILLPQLHFQAKNQAKGRDEACGEGQIPSVATTGATYLPLMATRASYAAT